MISDVFTDVGAEKFDEVLEAVEAFGTFSKLNHLDAMKLRLIAEEMLGMAERLLAHYDSEFWVESEGKSFQLHLKEWAAIDREQREKLVSVSSLGKNAKSKGIFGKIVSALENALEDSASVTDQNYGVDMGFLNMGAVPAAGYAYAWSMRAYEGASPADARKSDWDGLEKSILAHIADDIVIGVRGNVAELVVKVAF